MDKIIFTNLEYRTIHNNKIQIKSIKLDNNKQILNNIKQILNNNNHIFNNNNHICNNNKHMFNTNKQIINKIAFKKNKMIKFRFIRKF